MLNQTLTSETQDRMDIHQTRSFNFEKPLPFGKLGQFPFVAEVFYADANLHPFSALSAGIFQIKSRISPKIYGRSSNLWIEEKGDLLVRVVSNLNSSKSVLATLYLPHALRTPIKRKRFQIDAQDEITVEFLLNNRYRISGANYPVFCILEYDEKEHHTVIVRSQVRIKEPVNWFVKTRWYWIAGIVPMVLTWAVIGLRRAGNELFIDKD